MLKVVITGSLGGEGFAGSAHPASVYFRPIPINSEQSRSEKTQKKSLPMLQTVKNQESWYSAYGILNQVFDVAHWWSAELTAVFATELGRALVADLECGPGSIDMLSQHQSPCLVQAHPLLVLERAHSRHRAEVAVKS